MNSRFQAGCEAAALTWDVPALAAGYSVGGEVSIGSVGCEPETIFRIASITKPFTATLAVDLLDLDASTGVWPSDVRVRHLLSHTSGFDCECGDLSRFGAGDDALAAVAAELPEVRRLLGVEQAWSYANTGYWLAGHLAAVRAGETFEAALAGRVLAPAALESTSFGEPELDGTGADANPAPYPRARRPSGGLVSNVPDLLRFGAWHLSRPESASLRVVHGKPAGGVYGLGLFGERVGGVEVWGHEGSYGGYQSSLLVIPDRGAVFVGLTNSSVGRHALAELEDLFFEYVLGSRRRVPETVELSAAVLESFAGSYANSDDRTDIVRSGNRLVAAFADGEFTARPIGQRTFEITEGERIRSRFDFPFDGFGRFGSRLAERVA
ncbi:MAG TPA: serine hydrolase domain-containing protein [Gaiellaceae bacterium]|nr:serine hydrolase domain-containing protein [Gaiellaceae bacterium]